MHRFYSPPENIKNDKIVISDAKEVHHICDVLRFKVSDEINIFDGRGQEYAGTIETINRQEVRIKIVKSFKIPTKSKISISLACALPKKCKFDDIVEKATELGVDEIIPIISERTIVSLGSKRSKSKLAHWQQIAINASKQAQRSFIPQVKGIINYDKFISEARKYDLSIMFCLEGSRKKIRDLLKDFAGNKVLILIGPEGDFSDREIALAKKYGCQFGNLGQTVLKVDTAAISAVSIISILSN